MITYDEFKPGLEHTLKSELDRKVFETFEDLFLKMKEGHITPSQMRFACTTGFSIVAGLCDPDLLRMIEAIDSEIKEDSMPSIFDDSAAAVFKDGEDKFIAIVSDSRLPTVNVLRGNISKSEKYRKDQVDKISFNIEKLGYRKVL